MVHWTGAPSPVELTILEGYVTPETVRYSGNVLEMLPEGSFVRIHRSYIVPRWRIENRKGNWVKLMGLETPLPVGRAHKDNLNNG